MNNGLNKTFTGKFPSLTPWMVTEKGVEVNGTLFPYENIEYFNLSNIAGFMTNGTVQLKEKGQPKIHILAFKLQGSDDVQEAVYEANCRIDELKGIERALDHLVSLPGTTVQLYEDHLVLKYMSPSAAVNIARGGASGAKKIDYDQITSLQFKKPVDTSPVGFIRFEYPGAVENRMVIPGSMDDENAIPVAITHLDDAERVYAFIEKRREEIKKAKDEPKTVVQQASAADEILKFKQLMDMGVISKEEFEAKKKELLGL